jgi:methylenetetrahydrofolate reductase (NADPH)
MSESVLARRISEIVKNKFTFSMEFFPPKTHKHQDIFRNHVLNLGKINIDFCSITYGAGGTTTELTPQYVAGLSRHFDAPAIAHLTCIDHTFASLKSELDLFDSYGIRNILALRGDPKDGVSYEDSREIPHALDLMNHLGNRSDYCVGVAAHPEGHIDSVKEDFDYQAEKISQADFAITQLFYDIDIYEKFVDKMHSRGVNTPIIPGILPLTNMKRVDRIVELSGTKIPQPIIDRLTRFEDGSEAQRQEGEDFISEMCEELKKFGVRGLHFYTMNRADSVVTIFERLQ